MEEGIATEKSHLMKSLRTSLFLLFFAAFAQGQQLNDYIQEALDNNPEIQAYLLRYDIAREKVNESNTLPNTDVGLGYFLSEPETRTGAQIARISVRQMLPWFGTAASRQDFASSMAETDYVDYQIARRKLKLAVAESYYQLYGLMASQGVLDENIQLLQTYETLALTSVEVGKASIVDVLKLQIRQNELQQQKEVLEEQFKAAQTDFNNLLNRDVRYSIAPIPEVSMPADDPIAVDSLQLNPELLRYDKMYESVTKAELLNQKERAPMFGIGLDYVPVQERPDVAFSDNGKDILMPMVSLSIPIFNKQFGSRTRQNELRKEEIAVRKQDRLNMLETAYAKAVSQRNEARIVFNAQVKNLKHAQDAEEILIKNYETGTIDFKEVLDIQELQLKFQLHKIESLRQYYIQSALINYLTNASI